MFVRIKKIKGKEYAYLVKNFFSDKGPRQKVIKYIGKVVKPKKLFDQRPNLKDLNFKEALLEASKAELLNHGFVLENKILRLDDIEVDLEKFEVKQRNNKKIALFMNEGFFCQENLKSALELKAKSNFNLVSALLELGLKPNLNEIEYFYHALKNEGD
mgnify:CR=1 FL=1